MNYRTPLKQPKSLTKKSAFKYRKFYVYVLHDDLTCTWFPVTPVGVSEYAGVLIVVHQRITDNGYVATEASTGCSISHMDISPRVRKESWETAEEALRQACHNIDRKDFKAAVFNQYIRIGKTIEQLFLTGNL